MVNVKDFEKIEEKLRKAEGQEYFRLNQELTGPEFGIYYDEDEKKLKIAEDWTIDLDGNVVPCSNFGPGVQ